MIACIAGCLVLLALVPRQQSTPRPTVPVMNIAREVSANQKWDVAVAKGVGNPWRAVNVRYVAGDDTHLPHWQAGYQGKGSDYVAINQTKDGGSKWLNQVANGSDAGSVTVGGVAWKKVNLPTGDQKVLVRQAPLAGLDTIVTGKGTWDQLQQFAAKATPYSQAK